MDFEFSIEERYERHLPHIIPVGVPLFLTWNLKGSLPRAVLDEVAEKRLQLEREPHRKGESLRDRKSRHFKILFVMVDRYLDAGGAGPLHLKDKRAAKTVMDSLLFGAGMRYELYAFVVMPNHVHALFTPTWRLRRITQGIKGYTSRMINLLQGETGRTLWQDESYDHAVRDEPEFYRIVVYIENNPVVAGLCKKPEDWPCSSASMRAKWPVGQPFRPEMLLG